MRTKFIILITAICLFTTIHCTKNEPDEPANGPVTIQLEYPGDIPIDQKISCTLREVTATKTRQFAGRIERRGGISIAYPKHSYEIDLDEDASLTGLPSDDDWILQANYIDKTFLRHTLSYDLFRDMHPNNRASQYAYVELERNGAYNGLYVLMEKLDKSTLDIADNDPSAVIFKEPHIFRPDYQGITPQDPNNFHQQTFPDIEQEDKSAFAESIRDFILHSDDAQFTQQFAQWFDPQSVVDWHLLLLISNNGDGILKNFYMYKKDSGTPLRIAPWDYDHSFGRDGDNELNLDTRPLDIRRSILFKRLLDFDWYKSALKARWLELNSKNILSVSGLKNRIRRGEEMVFPFIERNAALWPYNASWYHDDNTFEQEIQIILQFIDLRHQRLTDYFNSL